MKCRSCDCILTDYEATLRSVVTRDYINLCKMCLGSIKTDVLAVGNMTLMADDGDDDIKGTESDLSGLFDDQENHFSDDH